MRNRRRPELALALFSETGAEVVFGFDSFTDRAGLSAGVYFGCEALLDFADVDEASCNWVDSRYVHASVSSALGFLPFGNVTLLPGLLRRACDADVERCDCESAANASTTVILPPDEPLIPTAVLQGPEVFSVCEASGLQVTNRASHAPPPRAMG